MSRYITSLIIFAAILGGVFYVNSFAESTTEDIIADIDAEISRTESESYDGSFLKEAQKIWDDCKDIFSAIVPHDKLDSIDVQFSVCSAWSQTEESDEYLASLYNLRSLIRIIRELDAPLLARIV